MSAADSSPRETCSYLPNLCAPTAVLAVVLIAELVAIALTLAAPKMVIFIVLEMLCQG